MPDMTVDVFADFPMGKKALEKINAESEDFRLYAAEWLDDERTVIKYYGAEFRESKSGKNKGKLSIRVPGTERTVLVPILEI